MRDIIRVICKYFHSLSHLKIIYLDFQLDTNNKEFQDALQLTTHTRQSVFLTGKAGTGKSTFLKYICNHTKKKYVVLAPTGIAAIKCGRRYLAFLFQAPFSADVAG